MSLELIPLVIRKGEKITLANEEGVTIQVGNSKGIIYQVDDTPANHEIKTLDFAEGKYTIVTTLEDELVSMQELTVLPIFQRQSKKEYLRETISLIENTIYARLANDESALAALTIKGNSFTYESIAVLQQLKKDYEKQLVKLIQQERRKAGNYSPITPIKVRLTR
ncbi:hypothetical protein OU675_10815 [Escherichia coli]|uniref:Uncharacterized protein n=1 Tax=Escherichia coli TaxID=562 RepID=A0A8S7E6H1_ECOLX|nr:hypothetical protein [Escherichia marmotae]EFB3613374.1 hypothetical protein [Escherichia coli]EFB3633654.1 hypothetical protein [Escherichia coli]EFB5251473.1 hypothetical protein [Escherichia coli]EFH7453566.1 hypothetical protein [Escherichia coli]MDF9069038.1 hypothetical protein [Escherichia coli]